MSLAPGTKLAHYEIVEPIGKGGMGEVYRATDGKLGRDVAIKVLPEELARDRGRLERFEREARAASALNHPNIVTIYEVREHDGNPYIVMEYVEGVRLREILASGPVPNDELVRYATQLAEGLAKAHQAGIVHRDLKPDNVVVSNDGYLKILDFGLAKLLISDGALSTESPTLAQDGTQQGQIMGTPGYMSPEQALGQMADARTDVFSFGVVLYEMATGARPFQGGTPMAIFEAMQSGPAPPSSLNPDLPMGWDSIVGRALNKVPSDRFDSAAEMLKHLSTVSHTASTTREKGPSWKHSIVVLPFQDLSPDRDNEHFSDGLTDEIITDLSQLPELRVISLGSAMALKGTNRTPPEIGRELDVEYLLQGSVRKAGNRLRIGAHLVDTKTDSQLWTEKYNGDLDDVFEIQEKVSRSIVEALKLKWSPGQEEGRAARRISDVRAYEYYERARQEIWLSTQESLGRAVELLEKGLEIVGDNDVLYGAMGTAYTAYINVMVSSDENYLRKAEACADKAQALNPSTSHLRFLKGFLHFKRGRVQDAIRELKRALSLELNHAEASMALAYFYGFSGKAFAARPILQRLLVIDPLTPINHCVQGLVEMLDGRVEAAVQSLQKVEQLAPGNPFFGFELALALAHNDRSSQAIDRLAVLGKESPDAIGRTASFVEHALRGAEAEALAALTPDVKAKLRWDEQFSYWLAVGYALLNRTDDAFDWFSNAVERGWICYPYLSEYAPFIDNLREDPRFEPLMNDVKHRWESLEV